MSAVKLCPIPPLNHQGRVPTLVKLPPPDDGDTIDYNAALTICGILSNN